MDEFFQKLREIQKKERNLSGLAPVGENFYQNISNYFSALMQRIDNNPFSFESYLLRDAQRITAEICERREHKISNSAVMSVQRTYQLFKESESDSPTPLKIPRNSTPEEEKLFHGIVDSLLNYREKKRGPSRFNNSKTKVVHPVVADIEPSPDIKEDVPRETSIEKDAGTGIDKPPKDNNQGFTAEEEAALEDDVYKQFGRESFTGGDKGKGSESSLRDKPSDSKPSPSDPEPSDEEAGLKENPAIKKSDDKKIGTDVLMVLEELPSIMGVDKKIYGPLLPQDIVTIPEPNARIIIKNQKGKSIQKYK